MLWLAARARAPAMTSVKGLSLDAFLIVGGGALGWVC